MLNLLSNINPADVIAFARAIPTPDNFLLTREIVPERQINNVKYRIRNTERRVHTAKFRAWDTETPIGRREVTHSILEGYLPPLGAKFVVGELEEILLNIERGTDDTALVEALYDDIERGVIGVKARLELAAGDLLTDGKFTLVDENGLNLEADFGVAAEFLPTATTLWSDTTNSTPLTDEMAWRQLLIDNGEGPHGDVVTSNKVFSYFGRNKEYRAAYYGSDAASVPTATLNPTQVNSVRANYGLPPVRIYDEKVYVDGTLTRTLPENRYLLLPSEKRTFAETQYGITAEALALSRSGNPRLEREQQPGIVGVVREEDDPVRVWSKTGAVAMPVLYAPKGFVSAQVIA